MGFIHDSESLVCLEAVTSSSGERHQEKSLGKRLLRCREGDDAYDALLRAYSKQAMRLYFVGPYPFALTRQTRRQEQKAPYLRGS